MTLFDFFRENGSPVAGEGNRPLPLTDPRGVWLLESGKVNVFSVAIKGDGVAGARDFLFEVEAGGLLFGLNPEGPEDENEEEKIALLAAGLPGTRLWRVELDVFIRRLKLSGGADMFLLPLERWVKALAGGAGAAGAWRSASSAILSAAVSVRVIAASGVSDMVKE